MHKTNILLPVNSRLVKIDISTLSTALLYFICLMKTLLEIMTECRKKELRGIFYWSMDIAWFTALNFGIGSGAAQQGN